MSMKLAVKTVLLVLPALLCVGATVSATACPFEIIKNCGCPANCNSDSCEKSCVVVGSTSDNCIYSCQACECQGYACPRRPAPFSVLSGFVKNAEAAEIAPLPVVSTGTMEFRNADGDFLVVPKSQAERLDAESGRIGVAIVKSSSGAVEVGGVAKGGPAMASGLKTGEEIVSVDGRATAGMPLTTVSKWLRGMPMTFVVLRVRSRDGKVRKVTINRSEPRDFESEKIGGVSLKTVPLARFKSTTCPAESEGCHLISRDGDDCLFSCRNAH